jgi:hypothetical protein
MLRQQVKNSMDGLEQLKSEIKQETRIDSIDKSQLTNLQ